ncbi:MAG: 3-phenylpropionate/cinnamic acid dioxygenase subunit beta [bacterium]|nr:3-phenylpropionate/cinnamic acid dioxygenase subunit beta [bacterium]
MSAQVTHHEIEQFLFEEAYLLDERRFDDWLALLSDDVRYWMPTRRVVAKSRPDTQTTVREELAGEAELGWFEDTKLSLLARVLRLKGGITWSEDPPSRTRRIVSNVHVRAADQPDEYHVRSYFLLHRTRHLRERESFIGSRNDLLRNTKDGIRIAAREIILDEAVLDSPNLSVFF